MKPFKKLTSVYLTAFQYLHAPIWLYDPQNGQVQWANDAALQLLDAENFDEFCPLFKQYFRSKLTPILNRLNKHELGIIIEDNCKIYFQEKIIYLRCHCSKVETEEGQLAILVEGHLQQNPQIDPEILRLLEIWRHTTFMISLYSLEGELLLQNSAAQKCYGNLDDSSTNNSSIFLNRFLDPKLGQQALDCINQGKIFSVETQVKTENGLCWHKIEARKTEDPVTGNPLILVNEKDINDRKQAEEKLRESQRFLEKLTNTVPQILYLFDLTENKSLYLNQRSIEILGYSPEEFCTWEHELLIDHFHPEDRHLCYSLPNRFDYLQDDEILSTEYRFRHKNGEWRWLNCREIVFQRDAKGKPLQVLGSVTDISDRKQAEIALQSLSHRLQHLLTSSPGIIYSCQPQGNYGVTYISENVKTVLGFDAETFLNNPHHFWYSRIHPEDLGTINNGIKTLFKKGKITIEYRCLHSDQTYHWIYDQAQLLKDERGQPIEIIGYIIDISTRKRAELDLQNKTELLEAIFNHIPIMLTFFNSEGRIEFINREMEQVLGWSFAEWQQQNLLFQCYPNPHDYQQVVTHMQATNRQWKDFQTRTATGEIVETSWTNIRLSDGSQIGIGQDITARKQNEKRLREQAQREKLITLVTQRIRQSLNLDNILETTVAEIRQLLQTDRVLIYRFEPDKRGTVIAESVNEFWLSLRGKILFDEGLASDDCIHAYTHGRIQNTSDIYNSGLPDCYIQLLAEFQVRANLVIPILHGEKLWGLLVAQHCSEPRLWQNPEIELLRQLADQVAIAISQSELYQYAQYQAQREHALNEVIQAIRNSLDLNTIFATASNEIAGLLYADWVHIVQYLPERKVWLNVGEYCRDPKFKKALGTEISDEDKPFAAQLKQLEIVQVADINQVEDEMNSAYARTYPGAWLLIPIYWKSSFWGSLSLIRNSQHSDWQSFEIELARTVANQLAIAIQQSQLYQQLQQVNQELQHLATHDQLTQLPNRRYFDEYLNQEWHRLIREKGLLCLILCDVDYFKRYNDTYGHPAGDECLVNVAQAIRRAVRRPADLAARYGGEEFVIILPNTDSLGAIQVVENIQADIFQLHLPHESSSVSSQITLSFGIAQAYPTTVNSPESLVKKADLALYQAKENGRNCYYLSNND
ncbi:diguanylate cyclase domain-containing protein [Capilliphycus salinus ALCB114379]|uniref:diguanylate cyclase domain-containing protein n=1 Tax=Capilliphycus salinus TaxID=2768948 RepID=UPI0039A562A9